MQSFFHSIDHIIPPDHYKSLFGKLQTLLRCFDPVSIYLSQVEAGSKMDNQETLPVDPNAEDMEETDNQDHKHEGGEEETQDPDPIVEASADEDEDFSDIYEHVPEHEDEAAPDHGPSGDVPKTKPKPREVPQSSKGSDPGGSEKQPDVTHPELASEEEGHETKGTHKDCKAPSLNFALNYLSHKFLIPSDSKKLDYFTKHKFSHTIRSDPACRTTRFCRRHRKLGQSFGQQCPQEVCEIKSVKLWPSLSPLVVKMKLIFSR